MFPLFVYPHNYSPSVVGSLFFNRQSNAPDFFNAKLRINRTLWVGNVSVMENASDWYLYGMDKDKSYDNVILTVVGNADTDIRNSKGDYVNVMPMEIPQNLAKRYLMLASDQGQALCHQNVKENCTRLTTRSWLCAIQTERLEWQCSETERRAIRLMGRSLFRDHRPNLWNGYQW